MTYIWKYCGYVQSTVLLEVFDIISIYVSYRSDNSERHMNYIWKAYALNIFTLCSNWFHICFFLRKTLHLKYKGSTLLAFRFTFITGGIFNPYIPTSKTQDWAAVNIANKGRWWPNTDCNTKWAPQKQGTGEDTDPITGHGPPIWLSQPSRCVNK